MKTLSSAPSTEIAPAVAPRQDLIDRCVGASVTAIFGALWIASGACMLMGPRAPLLAAIGVLAAALVAAPIRLVSRATKGRPATPASPERIRRNKQFHRINGLQWGGICALIVALNLLHRPEWITDGIVLIVGLHFLPLARLFRSTNHSLAGIALVIWALLYPQLASDGPLSPWGAMGAGMILWVFSGSLIVLMQHRQPLRW